jgi:hypothetical protein
MHRVRGGQRHVIDWFAALELSDFRHVQLHCIELDFRPFQLLGEYRKGVFIIGFRDWISSIHDSGGGVENKLLGIMPWLQRRSSWFMDVLKAHVSVIGECQRKQCFCVKSPKRRNIKRAQYRICCPTQILPAIK